MFFAVQVDRGNLTQDIADNMLKELKLATNSILIAQLLTCIASC
jgi:hypothetical protein